MFDGLTGDVNPWTRLQKFLCNNDSGAHSVTEVYAKEFKKKQIIEDINQKFARGHRLEVYDSDQWDEETKLRFEEFLMQNKTKNNPEKDLNQSERLKKQQDDVAKQAMLNKQNDEKKASFMKDKQ